MTMQKIHFTKDKIEQYIVRILQQKILVIGDLMLDQFIWGKVNRISPEAPVPVVKVTHESAYPGGAANVARNLADFGIHSTICGLIGQDSYGNNLSKLLQSSHISTDGILALKDFKTIQKTRIIARQQQVVRVDREDVRPILDSELDKLQPRLESLIAKMDAIIIEDYGKGFVTQNLLNTILSIAKKYNKIITVDPNPANPLEWSGVTLVKPNRKEAFAAARKPFSEDMASVMEVGTELLEQWKTEYLLITLGEEGMVLFHPPETAYHTPTMAREVYDVSGAGDTAIAFFTAALSAGLSGPEAAEIANHAAGIVVAKLGTATLKVKELFESLVNHE